MARTKGAISSANISWSDLRELLGDSYNGKIPVNVVWLRNMVNGTEDFTMVKRGELSRDLLGLEVEQTSRPVVRRPKFEVLGEPLGEETSEHLRRDS